MSITRLFARLTLLNVWLSLFILMIVKVMFKVVCGSIFLNLNKWMSKKNKFQKKIFSCHLRLHYNSEKLMNKYMYYDYWFRTEENIVKSVLLCILFGLRDLLIFVLIPKMHSLFLYFDINNAANHIKYLT